MAGDASFSPWGIVSSKTQHQNKGFFNINADTTSPSKSRSFKDVLADSPGDILSSLTPSTFNGVPAVLISDDEVLKLASPFRYTLVGKFGVRRPNLDAIRSFFGSIFGRPLQTDQATASRTRPSVARVLVEVDITKKHDKEVLVGSKALGYLQKVEFEKIHDFCTHYKAHGHSIAECFKLHPELKKISNNSTGLVEENGPAIDRPETATTVTNEGVQSNVEKVGNVLLVDSNTMPPENVVTPTISAGITLNLDDKLTDENSALHDIFISVDSMLNNSFSPLNLVNTEYKETDSIAENRENAVNKETEPVEEHEEGEYLPEHILTNLTDKMAEKPVQTSLSPTRRGGIPNSVFALLATAKNLLVFLPPGEGREPRGNGCRRAFPLEILPQILLGPQEGQDAASLEQPLEILINKFFWGSSYSNSSISWAKWLKLCGVYKEGALGCNYIFDMVKGLHPLNAQYKNTDSAEADLNIQWGLGNGDVAFWQDDWFGFASIDKILNTVTLENVKVNAFLVNGEWNTDRLREAIPYEVVALILKIPLQLHIKDKILFKNTSNVWNHFSTLAGVAVVSNQGDLKDLLNFKHCNALADYLGLNAAAIVEVRRFRIVNWVKPNFPFVKLNTDGSVGINCVGIEGIIRDHLGNPLDLFSGPLVVCSVMSVELLSLSYELERCLNLGFHHVNIEVDATSVINAISESNEGNPQDFYTIRKIKMMMSELSCFISHIYREGNVCADWLAKYGAQSSIFQNFSVINLPPPLKGMILLDKFFGVWGAVCCCLAAYFLVLGFRPWVCQDGVMQVSVSGVFVSSYVFCFIFGDDMTFWGIFKFCNGKVNMFLVNNWAMDDLLAKGFCKFFSSVLQIVHNCNLLSKINLEHDIGDDIGGDCGVMKYASLQG
ncbi:hypothetical protein KFK09_001965 [Dendrobium nobile]|uniref:RNase H type-1 domain-containing protein n=1 Tax=Dendrobium nobile TaxID=94219 RepID=A0A8T3C6A4_DENNO|nr:hypothetical protein KFK09_001965 [Dendrobium nobile]